MLESLDAVLGFSGVMLGVSLLVTVLVQTVSALFNLRGVALLRGLVTLFRQGGLDAKKARELADDILHHPLITDSLLTAGAIARATAIRKDELLRMLKQHEQYHLYAVGLEAGALLDIVALWFDSQMDRASQVFVHYARAITIAVSIVVAFAVHLDASVLIQRLYSDPDLRAKLVASASVLESRAAELDITTSATAPTPSAVPTPTAAPAPAEASTPTAPATAALPAAVPSAAAAPAAAPARPASANVTGGIPSAAPPVAAPTAGSLPAGAAATKPQTDLDKSLALLLAIRNDLESSGLEILPKFADKPDIEHGIHTPFDYFEPGGLRHFVGVLATAVLLSLGAPFWFNLLKQLTNLRSVVANKEQKEREVVESGSA